MTTDQRNEEDQRMEAYGDLSHAPTVTATTTDPKPAPVADIGISEKPLRSEGSSRTSGRKSPRPEERLRQRKPQARELRGE